MKLLFHSIFGCRSVPVGKQNEIKIWEHSRLAQEIVFISSFPRSGNTWMRYLLSDYFLQNMGIPTSCRLPVHPDKIIPDLYCNLIADREASIATPGLFIKTHDDLDAALKLIHKNGQASTKHIYIYRKPEDALVSLFYYHKRDQNLAKTTSCGINQFCLMYLESWKKNVLGYLNAQDKIKEKIYFVSYEQMLSDPQSTLEKLLRWLAVRCDQLFVENAVKNMSFSNLRANEEICPLSNRGFFFRSGKVGSGAMELSGTTLEKIHSQTKDVYDSAVSRLILQSFKQ